MKIKKILLIILLISFIVGLLYLMTIKTNDEKVANQLNVTVTNFVAYDFVKQIAGDNVNLNLILEPGIDSHSYEPTTKDLINIQQSNIFIYVGGEVERWGEKVIETSDLSNTTPVCLTDMIELIQEENVDGAEQEDDEESFAYDEHVWTSPENAKIMVEEIAKILSKSDKTNEETYMKNAETYIEKIANLQSQIQEIVDNRVRDRLIFGDKMPMQYFLKEFGITASAAFNGCSTETEPSSSVITYLIEKVKQEKIPVVLYIELSTGQVAKIIAEEAGVDVMQIQTLHNVSKDDFKNGETYVSLMERNLDVLRKALQ